MQGQQLVINYYLKIIKFIFKQMNGTTIKERIQKTDGTSIQRQYLLVKQIGKGAFGQCYQAIRQSDKKKFAIKIIDKVKLENKRLRMKLITQIKLHGRSKHKNICELERAFEDQKNVYILLQLCSNGSMFQLLKKRKKLTVIETQFFIFQLIHALCYLHSREIIHRDIKLGNLLIDSNMNLKLSDFGLSTKIQFKGDLKHSACGTPNYIAPEIIGPKLDKRPSGHSYQVDIWSTGVIMYLMLIGRPPFQSIDDRKTYQKICVASFDFPYYFRDEEAKDLIKKILVPDPSQRYTFQQILAHPFMNPKKGIPKQLTNVSLKQDPKFGIFEQYSKQDVKKAARQASATSLRSAMQQNFNEQMKDLQQKQNADEKQSKKKKQMKGLKSILSSSLSRSLKKLSAISRGSSPQDKSCKGLNSSTSNLSRINENTYRNEESIAGSSKLIGSSLLIRQNRSYSQNEQIKIADKKKQLGFVYIVKYKQEEGTTWSYELSNGYLGVYQPAYQLLFNNHNKVYFEIEGGIIKQQTRFEQLNNPKLKHYKKYFTNSSTPCQPLTPKFVPVFLQKIYRSQKKNIILFKLSNDTMQTQDYSKNMDLLIIEEDIMFIERDPTGKQIKTVVNKDDIEKCDNKIIDFYVQVKKMIKSLKAEPKAEAKEQTKKEK